ncbi:MAG: phospholipase D family protein [Fibrobacter sp.]|nr:phospholipase D family protein [Fibrobacter sp.]
MKFLSTGKCFKDNKKPTKVGYLGKRTIEASGKLQKLIIVSAYTDAALINKAISWFGKERDCRGRGHIAIYLDADSSRYYSSSKEKTRLNELARMIKQRFDKNSGIYLVNCSALFHSKFILSESTTHCQVVLGSINFTSRAFEKNEEIALSYCWSKKPSHPTEEALKNKLESYIGALDCSKIPNSTEKKKIFSVRSQLLNGSLYNELKEQASFRFDLHLPDEYLSYLNAKRKKNDDIPLDIKTSGSVSLEYLLQIAGIETKFYEKNVSRGRKNWKNYAIETCFGFWVPNGYKSSAVEIDIGKFANQKKNKLNDLYSKVNTNKEKLVDSFMNLMEKIKEDRKQYFKNSIGINGEYSPHNENDNWIYDREPSTSIQKDVSDWIKGITNKINPSNKRYKDYQQRLCRGVSVVNVPDVWTEDPLSTEEFESSLYDSIKYYLSVKDKVVKKICSVIDGKIKETMPDYLASKLTQTQILEAFSNASFLIEEEKK